MDVRLEGWFRLKSPLSHIGESISTVSYLSQEPIKQDNGDFEEVFCYSGNAWRGQLRDLAAAYMLTALQAVPLQLDVFHLLFAGGGIGGEQSVDLAGARAYRRAIPLIALWGGGVVNQVLPGKLRVSNAYPVCREAIPVLLHTPEEQAARVSYRTMTFEKSFSRKDDAKDERLNGFLALPDPAPRQAALPDGDAPPAKAGRKRGDAPATQMRMTVELLAAGVQLETHIDALDVNEVELGCLVSALHGFARSPHIGGQANRGHGLVDLAYELHDRATGEVRPFVAIVGGRLSLMPAAEQALVAYDAHLRRVYDEFLSDHAGPIRALLGAA